MKKNLKSKNSSIVMFTICHPEWKGRIDIQSPPHSREFILLWDNKPIGVVRQFIPVGRSQGFGTCRFQAQDMDGAHVGPVSGYSERLTAIEQLIKRVQ